MDVLLAPDLPAALVVARPDDPAEQVLVVVAGGLSRSDVRGLSRLLLRESERVELARVLRGRETPHARP